PTTRSTNMSPLSLHDALPIYTEPEEKPDHPVAIPVNGEWQTFPNQRAAEQAAYQEYRDNLRRNAENFRITDEHLGEGGPKAKYQDRKSTRLNSSHVSISYAVF